MNRILGILLLLLFTPAWGAAGTTIHDAASTGDVAQVKALLAANPQLAQARITMGHTGLTFRLTPLHVAKTGEVAAALLDAKADIEARNGSGMTPLHTAAYYGRVDVMKVLIARKANINALADDLSTPLHWAAVMNQPEAVRALLQAGAKYSLQDANGFAPLQRSLQRGEFTDVLGALMAAGADPWQRAFDGSTAISAAIAGKKYLAAQALLAKAVPAQLNVRGDDGNALLHLAALQGATQVAEALLVKGADLNVTDLQGQTPLHLAAIAGNSAIVKIVLSKGGRANIRTHKGMTPLMLAKAADVIQLLLESGANIDITNNAGQTALFLAVAAGQLDKVKLLLDRGANPDIPDYLGLTPLAVALRQQKGDIANLLKERGAKQ